MDLIVDYGTKTRTRMECVDSLVRLIYSLESVRNEVIDR